VVGVDRRTSGGLRPLDGPGALARLAARRLWLARELLTFLGLTLATVLAFLLRADLRLTPEAWEVTLATALLVAGVQWLLLVLVDAHRRSWRFTSLGDAVAVLRGLGASLLLLAILRLGVIPLPSLDAFDLLATLPWAVLIGGHLFALLSVLGMRLVRRGLAERGAVSAATRSLVADRAQHRAIVVGSGVLAVGVLRELSTHEDAPVPVEIGRAHV